MRHKKTLVKINSLRWFLDSNWSMMVITSQVSPDSSWIVADHQLMTTLDQLQTIHNVSKNSLTILRWYIHLVAGLLVVQDSQF